MPRCNCGSSEPEVDRGADLKFEFEFKTKPQSIDRTNHPDHASALSRENRGDALKGHRVDSVVTSVASKGMVGWDEKQPRSHKCSAL